jgi:L-lactate dehydrogenase complex protein LldF
MRSIAWVFGSPRRLAAAQRLGRMIPIRRLPGPLAKWTRTRDLKPVAAESFRSWWKRERS